MTKGQRQLSGAFGCALLAALVVTGLSCDDNTSTCPACRSVTIRGTILAVGEPANASIHVRTVGSAETEVWLRTVTDSTGYYEVPVPPGAYYIRATPYGSWYDEFYYGHDQPVWSRDRADTVTVNLEDVRADFVFGALTVSLALPGTPDLVRCDARLLEVQESGWEWRARYQGFVGVENESITLEWSAIPPGTYAVLVELDGNSSVYLPGSRLAEEAHTFRVEPGTRATATASLDPPAIMTGQVLGSSQSPHSTDFPGVTAFSDDSLWVAETSVSPDATFEFPLYLPVPVRLRVTIGRVARWMGGNSFADATRYQPTSGEILTVDPYFESGILCRFSGPGNRTDHDARCRLYDSAGNQILYETSGGRNPFLISNLSASTYYLQFANRSSSQRWMPQWFDRVDSLAEATPIEIPGEGEIAEISVQFTTGGVIQGQLLTSGQPPQMGAYVRVCEREDVSDNVRVTQASATTGEYIVEGLPDGEYIIGLVVGYLDTYWYPGTWAWQLAEAVKIEGHATVSGISWTVPESLAHPEVK